MEWPPSSRSSFPREPRASPVEPARSSQLPLLCSNQGRPRAASRRQQPHQQAVPASHSFPSPSCYLSPSYFYISLSISLPRTVASPPPWPSRWSSTTTRNGKIQGARPHPLLLVLPASPEPSQGVKDLPSVPTVACCHAGASPPPWPSRWSSTTIGNGRIQGARPDPLLVSPASPEPRQGVKDLPSVPTVARCHADCFFSIEFRKHFGV